MGISIRVTWNSFASCIGQVTLVMETYEGVAQQVCVAAHSEHLFLSTRLE